MKPLQKKKERAGFDKNLVKPLKIENLFAEIQNSKTID